MRDCSRRSSGPTRRIGGSRHPDFFPALLLLELHGHAQVFAGRRDLALLRLLQNKGGQVEVADSLRLLRQAADKKSLDLVLNKLREAGPLAVLNQDARQILRTRTSPLLLRTVEMRVLRASAELLAPSEARGALDAVLTSFKEGGPHGLPYNWELAVLRHGVAWTTAAALAEACSAESEVADLLLHVAQSGPAQDQLFDNGLAAALRALDWDRVPPAQQSHWLRAVEGPLSGLTATPPRYTG